MLSDLCVTSSHVLIFLSALVGWSDVQNAVFLAKQKCHDSEMLLMCIYSLRNGVVPFRSPVLIINIVLMFLALYLS